MTRAVLRHLASALCVLVCAACSFELSEHPASCKTSSDCRSGFTCYEQLCVRGSGSVAGASGTDAAAGDAGQSGGGSGGAAGSANSKIDAGMNTMSDAGMGSDAAGADASMASMADAATDAAAAPLLAPYADCFADGVCNPGETCRKNVGNAVCSAPCATSTECNLPAGSFGATPLCDTSLCRLDCSPKGVPPLPRTCPTGMTCIAESGRFTCYPQ